MAEKRKPIADQVAEMATPVVEQMGYDLWDVFYGKEGQNLVLRLTIDSPNGIGIQDCEDVSRAVDPLLDDIISLNEAYSFEVSSPGLGRKIRTDKQYQAYISKEVLIHLIRADESGERDHEGTLSSFDGESIVLETENGPKTIQRSAISYTKANDDKDLFNQKG